MMEFLLVISFFVALILVWRWVAIRMRKNGRGVVVRHLAGSSAGSLAAVLAISIIVAIFADSPPMAPLEQKAAAAAHPPLEATLPEYSVVSDEYMASIKRTVEISLPARISTAELSAIAKAMKANATHATDRTFIGYRIAGEPESGYWATTHYDPNLKVKVLEDF